MAARHIELGLTKIKQIWSSGPDGPVGRYIERLLDVVGDCGATPDDEKPGAFKELLGQSRGRLFQEVDATEFAREGRAAVLLCEQQFARLRRYHRDREENLADIIAVVTKAMQEVTGQSSAFNASLLVESERMGRLVQLDDIIELKREVAGSVGTLRQAVADRQRRDDEAQAALAGQVESLQSRLVEARNEAAVDQLTKIANRRTFDRTLSRWLSGRAEGAKRPFVLALFDIDDFKKVNDTHGHPVGDRVLLALAQRLNVLVRPVDLVARYGGEEFVTLLSNITLSVAEKRLAEIVRQTAEAVFEYDQDAERKQLRFTITCGAAECGQGDTAEELIKRADDALYDGKRAGKNRVVVKKRSRFGSLFEHRTADPR
jgi:diguanylate cyclase (GGDEF)-like protein